MPSQNLVSRLADLSQSFRFRWWICGLVIALSGCVGGPARVQPPSIDADSAGKLAIAQFDTNDTDSLTSEELFSVPAFDLKRLDADQNGSLTADEITARIRQWQDSNVGMVTYDLRLSLNGKPLAGATVMLEPLSFLGDGILAAEGVSGEDGLAILSVDPAHRPHANIEVLQCGFYRIRVSKKKGTQETIPARYNVNTELGCEVAPDIRTENAVLELKSK
jgi:hypothetical protein